MYKYLIGQSGAWFVGLLIGGFLPLLKSWVYSQDFWTHVILVPWVLAVLYLFLLVQEWFKTPKPVKPSLSVVTTFSLAGGLKTTERNRGYEGHSRATR